MHADKGLFPDPVLLPLDLITSFSKSFSHALLVLAMGHGIIRRPNTQRNSRALISQEWRSLHQHRFEAIQALNKELDDDETRFSDGTFEGIFLTLGTEVMEPS